MMEMGIDHEREEMYDAFFERKIEINERDVQYFSNEDLEKIDPKGRLSEWNEEGRRLTGPNVSRTRRRVNFKCSISLSRSRTV
jgi:hypothetical protein